MGRYFESWGDFLAMAPYGAFVWSSYGLVLLVCLVVLGFGLARFRRARAALGGLRRPSRKRSAE
ncbi:MAG: heme exporter protein CcmD [Alphaproteobacteria bacterium]|nr:heme exporter protein CcmD [Alphaproteobacteria bacterium]